MHELGIVFQIIKSVEKVGEEHKLSKVSAVTLGLGEVSQVVPKELIDCWNWAIKKTTLMAEANLELETIPAITLCESCKSTYETVKYGRICPNCHSEMTYLLQGREINLKDIKGY